MLPPTKEGTMRYNVLTGLTGAVLGAALTAGLYVIFVDRQGPAVDPTRLVDPAEAVLVYVAKKPIPKGTRITRNDLYVVKSVPRFNVEPYRIPAHPPVGMVARRDIPAGDQYTFDDYRYRPSRPS
jgi:hypothetical protein